MLDLKGWTEYIASFREAFFYNMRKKAWSGDWERGCRIHAYFTVLVCVCVRERERERDVYMCRRKKRVIIRTPCSWQSPKKYDQYAE